MEEALASDQMTADDLGFDSTRDLLEALEVFVKLTIFKGGRIYATIIAQPTWDEALAAFEATDGKKTAGESSGKPWKRKKADKTLKPVRPKRAKRPEPEPKPVPAQEPGARVRNRRRRWASCHPVFSLNPLQHRRALPPRTHRAVFP